MTARGIVVNKQRCCEIFGWSRQTFDTKVRAGMPVHQKPENKGGEYLVYTAEVIAWEIRQATGTENLEDLNAEREKAGLLKQQRLKTEFEVGILNGRYLLADEVEATDAVIFTALRDRIRAVKHCAPLLVQAALQEGELEVQRVLGEALNAALTEVGTATLVPIGEAGQERKRRP